MQRRDVIIKELGLESWEWDEQEGFCFGLLPEIFECPQCGKRLNFGVPWNMTEFGRRVAPDYIAVDCEDSDCGGRTYRQPYVYWLPVLTRAARFVCRVESLLLGDALVRFESGVVGVVRRRRLRLNKRGDDGA